MQITAISNVNFQSRNNPIKPFEYVTKNGTLKIYEVTKQELNSIKFFKQVTDLIFKNASKTSEDPFWTQYRTDHAQFRKRFPRHYMNYKKNITNSIETDPNKTFLVARDSKGNIQGICDAKPKRFFDFDKSLHIANLSVNNQYENQGVGKAMLETIVNANKNTDNAEA